MASTDQLAVPLTFLRSCTVPSSSIRAARSAQPHPHSLQGLSSRPKNITKGYQEQGVEGVTIEAPRHERPRDCPTVNYPAGRP